MGNFARALHHLDIKDVKRKRLEEIAAKKIKEQQDIKEKKIIKEISKKYKSDWKREIYEGMTTGNAMVTVLPAEGETAIDQVDPTASASFAPTTNMFGSDANNPSTVDTVIRNSGSGNGSTGGFNVGGDYLAFQGGSGSSRMALLKPMDATGVDTLTITAIRGTGSNGGEHPDVVGTEELFVIYKTPEMSRSSYLSQDRSQNNVGSFPADAAIIAINQGDGTLQNYTITIPEYARQKNVIFGLFQLGNSGSQFDHYGVTDIKFQRKTPLSVVVPLDSPEATSFVRVGSDEGDPKKRKKKLNDQLAASDEYVSSIMGAPFPGQGGRVDGEDPFKSATVTSDEEIEPSPIGKAEVKKSFSTFSADSATDDTDTDTTQTQSTSTQTTMNPTDDDDEPISVKTVGGKNSGAVQGADAATVDAQNAQDDAKEPETTEPETTEPEAIDPDDIKPDPDETKDKTPEEVKEIEKEKFNDQFDKQTNFFKKQMIEQVDKLVDLPVDKFVDFSVGIIKVLRGINQAGAVLARLGGLIGGLSAEQNDTLKFFETKQTAWEKMINDANIFRSTLTGRIEAQDYSTFQIEKLTKNLNPSQFVGDEFYVEGTGNFGISDTRHEYADDNVYVLNGKVYNNTDGDRRGVYATPLANMGVFTPEIDGIGRGYGQMIIPKDGSAPYFHYYDYNYFNMNSTDSGEIPSKFQQFMADLAGTVRKVLPGRLFNDVINRFEGNLNTFNNNLKERVGLDGWPPGIHGATLHDFKIPVSDMSEDMQKMIANHPLSWTPDRIANMKEDDWIDEMQNRMEGTDFENFKETMLAAMNDPDTGSTVDPEYLEKYQRFDFGVQFDPKTGKHIDAREGTVQYDYDRAVEELRKARGNPDYDKATQAAFKEWEDVGAEEDEKNKENNETNGTAAQLKLWEKLVGPYYRAVVKATTTKGGSMSTNHPTYQKLINGHKEFEKQVKVLEKKYAQGRDAIFDKYKKLRSEAYGRYEDTFTVRKLDDGTSGMVNGGDFKTKNGKVIAGKRTLTAKQQARFEEVRAEYDEVQEYLYSNTDYMDNMYIPYVLYDVKTGFGKYDISGDSWTPKKKGSGKTSTPDKPKPKPRSGSDTIAGLDEPIVGGGNKKDDRRKNESLEYYAHRFGDNYSLFERLKQKQFFNPNDIKPTFPENPPPQLDPKTGMHPNYGKNAKRFGKLDPASANSMPPTGDPETDAVVDKQRTKPKPKLYDKLKRQIRKDLTNK